MSADKVAAEVNSIAYEMVGCENAHGLLIEMRDLLDVLGSAQAQLADTYAMDAHQRDEICADWTGEGRAEVMIDKLNLLLAVVR